MDLPSRNPGPGQKQLSCPSPGHPGQSWRLRTGGRVCKLQAGDPAGPLVSKSLSS